MTAYLQPGDKIHIAFGIAFDDLDEMNKATDARHEELVAMYRHVGVEVVGSTGCVGLTGPVVVSVIRPKQQGSQLL